MSCPMIVTTNSIEGGTQKEKHEVSPCSPSLVVGLQQQWIYFSVANIFLSITAFVGNFLILVALNMESSLHPPSKLLYRCLATTDLLVGLITQPLYTIYWMSLVHKNWTCLLCSKIYNAACDHLQKKNYSSHEVIIDEITSILMYFNSILNPFLHCWKVREVRQAEKQTSDKHCFSWT